MATKHLYVSEDDETLWEQAAVLASRERRSVSWVIHQALRTYLRTVAVEQDKAARGRGAGRAQA